jgi:hypothetical protein
LFLHGLAMDRLARMEDVRKSDVGDIVRTPEIVMVKEHSVMNSLSVTAFATETLITIANMTAASTLEGGKSTTHKQCITWWQNSIQSTFIRCYADFYGMQPNEQFLVRIIPGCSSVSKRDMSKHRLEKRDSDFPIPESLPGNRSLLASSYNYWTANAGSNSSSSAGTLFAPLGEVDAGIYQGDLSFTGNPGPMMIVDGDGFEYFNLAAPSGQQAMQMKVNNSEDLVIAVSAETNDTASIAYNYTISALPKSGFTNRLRSPSGFHSFCLLIFWYICHASIT